MGPLKLVFLKKNLGVYVDSAPVVSSLFSARSDYLWFGSIGLLLGVSGGSRAPHVKRAPSLCTLLPSPWVGTRRTCFRRVTLTKMSIFLILFCSYLLTSAVDWKGILPDLSLLVASGVSDLK